MLTTYKVTLERTVTERVDVEIAVPDGLAANAAMVEGWAAIECANWADDDDTIRVAGPWRILDSDPPIAAARIVTGGPPRGKRKRKAKADEIAPVLSLPSGAPKPKPKPKPEPEDEMPDIPAMLRRT